MYRRERPMIFFLSFSIARLLSFFKIFFLFRSICRCACVIMYECARLNAYFKFLRIHKFFWWTNFSFQIIVREYDILFTFAELWVQIRDHTARTDKTERESLSLSLSLSARLPICQCLFNTCSILFIMYFLYALVLLFKRESVL